MTTEIKNIIKLDLKKEEKILNFSDFKKQNIKFLVFGDYKWDNLFKRLTKKGKYIHTTTLENELLSIFSKNLGSYSLLVPIMSKVTCSPTLLIKNYPFL